MKWTFQLRGQAVTLTSVDKATAVRPTRAAQSQTTSRAALTRQFGTRAIDDARGGRFGLDLPAQSRQVFERAGWLFVDPVDEVAEAARMTRGQARNSEAVQQVFTDPSGNIQVTTDLITVQLDPEMSENEAQQRVTRDGLQVTRRLAFARNAFEVTAVGQTPLMELVQQLQEDSTYRFAEPMLLQAISGRFKPTDPRLRRQWQLDNDGSNGGVAGADIRAFKAWDLTRGLDANNRPIRIAVIDNGMQVNHPDLEAGIVGGGYFESDGMGGATFVPYQPGMDDFPPSNHGTFCLGMAGGRMNNNRGGCGSAPEAALIAIGCLVDQIGTQATLARAVAYAADPTREDGQAQAADGADIIVSSLGPSLGADWALTSVLDLALRFAANQGRGGLGAPLFWASSNGLVDVTRDEVVSHPDVLAVGRSNRLDRADGSAHGATLAFLAPGRDVYSTSSGSRYEVSTGTSFAAPLAAGVGALVLARNPQFTAQQVRARLLETCDKVGGVQYVNGRHDEYGHGRLNAFAAVQ